MDVIIHVVGKVDYLSDILKSLFLLQGCVELRDFHRVKLCQSRRKEIQAVNVSGTYHVIGKCNVPVRIIGIAVNEKVLRIICGNADTFHSGVKLLFRGGHIKPSAARLPGFKTAAAVNEDSKLSLCLFRPLLGDSCLRWLRLFLALHGVAR